MNVQESYLMQKDIDIQKGYGKYYIVITPFFPTKESFRGPYVYDQVKAIERTGKYKVLVFKPTSFGDNRDSYEYDGIRVHLFHAFQMPSYLFNGFSNGLNNHFFLRKIKGLGVNVADIAIAHGHTSTFGAYALALKKLNNSITTVVQHHDRDPFTVRNGRLTHWKTNLRYRAKSSMRIFNQIDCHVSISKVVEDNLLSFPLPGKYETYKPYLSVLGLLKGFPSVQPKKSLVVYNGVDTSKFYPKSGLRNKDFFTIGCIGNFQELKGQIVLIKAVERLLNKIPNIRVVFIGTGELLETCKSYVIEHALSKYITFQKEVHHDQLNDYYNTLDLFVLPTCYEGFGCVFTEAVACGVPFMLCEHQGASEYIPEEDASKWLFTPYDDLHLSKLIYRYYTHRYSQNLRYSYDIDQLIPAYLEKLL